jgi:hypothetical protein
MGTSVNRIKEIRTDVDLPLIDVRADMYRATV